MTERAMPARRRPRRFWHAGPALLAGGVLILIFLAAILAPAVAPHDPYDQDIVGRNLLPPGFLKAARPSYVLGTDALGRDLLSRIMFGARVSLLVGTVAVAVSGTLGVTLGLVSGYYGGRPDRLLMRLAEVQLSFPFIQLAISVIAVQGAGLRNIILVLGVTGWVTYARIVRGTVLTVKTLDFVTAAKALGAPDRRIIVRHILPNVLGSVAVIATFSFAQMILAEAGLSFLGLGVQPPSPTWGGFLAEGRLYLAYAWWLTAFPGLAFMLTVLS
ncbi:MAG: ABC transporter permease, partial [Armatimonadetes bacterium]|nr:ABC transporter permease [Armatimonadota bacterium]